MKKILVTLMAVGFLSSAHAGFYGNIGLDLGASGEYDTGSGGIDLDGNPMILDIQLGWSTFGLSYGLDYEKSLTDIAFDLPGFDPEASMTTYGIFVGYEFPIMFRIYGAYMLGGSLDFGVLGEVEGVSGTKLGLAYTGFPLIDIYVEMRSYEYDEDSTGTALNPAEELSLTSLGVAYSF